MKKIITLGEYYSDYDLIQKIEKYLQEESILEINEANEKRLLKQDVVLIVELGEE